MESAAARSPATTRITFLGHSTVLIEVDGLRLLSDPILRPRVGPLVRAAPAADVAHVTDIDAVLISHSHWDHFDLASLRMVGRATLVVVPRGMGTLLRARGFRRIVELEPGERIDVGTVGVEATHAEHRGFGRPVFSTDRSVGYLLHGPRLVYFAGDTALFEGMAELARGLDLALIPVWGWGPTVRSSEHLDPLGAARALTLLRPRLAVPIHWGTLHPVGLRWFRPSTRIDPPHQFAQLARRYAPHTSVHVLPVGGSLHLEGHRTT
jgi:L-ascorbate metabolism protein UlaG (beta-lactamase superfamily)